VLVLLGCLGLGTPAQGLEPNWPTGPYKYLVIDQDIKDVLTELGRNIKVPVELSNQIKGRLRGRPPGKTAKEFLDNLCESYGLVWHYDGAVLHIFTKTEVKTEVISVGHLKVDNVDNELKRLGISDPRFTVRSSPGGDVISVSGPPSFIALVRQAVTAMTDQPEPVHEEKLEDEPKVKIFRGNRAELAIPVAAVSVS